MDPSLHTFEPYMLPRMNLDRERRQLVFHIKTAQTPEQIRTAKKAVNAWMFKQSEDTVIRRAARELATKEAWLRTNGQWH
jgi:hypothetical protein